MITHQEDNYNKEFRRYSLLTKQNILLRFMLSGQLETIPFHRDERVKWIKRIISTAETIFDAGEEVFPPDDISWIDE